MSGTTDEAGSVRKEEPTADNIIRTEQRSIVLETRELRLIAQVSTGQNPIIKLFKRRANGSEEEIIGGRVFSKDQLVAAADIFGMIAGELD